MPAPAVIEMLPPLPDKPGVPPVIFTAPAPPDVAPPVRFRSLAPEGTTAGAVTVPVEVTEAAEAEPVTESVPFTVKLPEVDAGVGVGRVVTEEHAHESSDQVVPVGCTPRKTY